MLHTATRIVDGCPLPTKCLEVPPNADLTPLHENANRMLRLLDQGDGVLLITDIYGATPNNLARALANNDDSIEVLAGLNLPMLVRIFNYPTDDLKTLCNKAADGGSRSIQICPL